MKAQRAAADALFDNFLKADERAATEKQNVGGIDRRKFLVRVFAPALRRNVGDRAFENLEQRLLYALTTDVAGNGRILVLLGDLIDLVDIDDALLRLLHVAIGGL